ncbi:MAG: neutral/alkaline non-lysosomal ceramidase N-terminal domain-containing protein [Cyclobacteriaceae bacterium]
MRILKRILITLGVFIGILSIISLFLFTWVDRTPYQEMEYYSQTMEAMGQTEASDIISVGDTLEIGWGKESLVPEERVPLAGYGKRQGALYDNVHDTIWAKSFVFDNGVSKTAFVTMDLLIVPMEVTRLLPEALDSMGYNASNIFLSAGHSHCSIGGWGTGLAGELFAGSYDQAVVDFIVKSAASAIYNAEKHKQKAGVGYAEIRAADLVRNRLVGDQKGTIDPWIRMLKFENESGEAALLTTYSAHSTCLSHRFHDLSADYPGELCKNLEVLENIDFAAFAAGAMGSMTSLAPQPKEWSRVEYYAKEVSKPVALMQNAVPLKYDSILGNFSSPLYLRQPHFRISENIRARPWVFDLLMGSYPSEITSLRIGNILFVGTPCDFSGELVEPLTKKARQAGLNLVITSFNGGYAGYITKDEWYDLDKYETRVMNWFGPYNGAYFSEVIEKVIDLHAEAL